MSNERCKFTNPSLPDDIKELVATDVGLKAAKYFSEHPDELQTAIRMRELQEKAAEAIRHNPKMQETIRLLTELMLKKRTNQQQLLIAQQAAEKAALSETVGAFKKYAGMVRHFQEDVGVTPWDYSGHLAPNASDNDPVPETARDEAIAQEQSFKQVIIGIAEITSAVRAFLDEFKETATRNEKASKKWALASTILSIVAILVSLCNIFNDKTGELVKVVREAHPWSEQQISADDAKNISVAFHFVTKAVRENIQNRREIAQLYAGLSEIRTRFVDIQKKYDDSVTKSRQEQQELQSEIAKLKIQIEKMKIPLKK